MGKFLVLLSQVIVFISVCLFKVVYVKLELCHLFCLVYILYIDFLILGLKSSGGSDPDSAQFG